MSKVVCIMKECVSRSSRPRMNETVIGTRGEGPGKGRAKGSTIKLLSSLT